MTPGIALFRQPFLPRLSVLDRFGSAGGFGPRSLLGNLVVVRRRRTFVVIGLAIMSPSADEVSAKDDPFLLCSFLLSETRDLAIVPANQKLACSYVIMITAWVPQEMRLSGCLAPSDGAKWIVVVGLRTKYLVRFDQAYGV